MTLQTTDDSVGDGRNKRDGQYGQLKMAMNQLKSALILGRSSFIPVQMTPNSVAYNNVYTNIVQVYSNTILTNFLI